jgi:hypothetical protein
MSITTYNNIDRLSLDLQLYLYMSQGIALTLGVLPSLAKLRYPWIVTSWNTLYSTFKNYANGDDDLESALDDFNSSVNSYKLGNTNNVLDSFDKFVLYKDFLSLIDIQAIGLTQSESDLVAVEQQRVSNFSIETFLAMKTFLRNYLTAQCYSLGLGDATATKALGSSQVPKIKTATISDLSAMENTNTLINYVDNVVYLLRQQTDRAPNLLAIANNNIQDTSKTSVSDIYSSYVTVPFEISLESMAKKYLDSEKLWYELVTVNNLQPPYVDEVGMKYLLLAPGANNNITISSDRRNDLHLGAKVSFGSVKMREEYRYIEKITYNNDNTMTLYVSGDPDLSKLKTTEYAFVRIYQPHTVSTGSFIKIPVSLVSGVGNSKTPNSDELRRLDKSLLAFGVDIGQDEITGDLIIDSSGNFNKAFGIRNVSQAVTNAMRTVKGELTKHPNYGLDINLGTGMFGPQSSANIVSQIVVSTILKDPRIVGAKVKSLSFTASSISMTVEVLIAGSDTVIPLSFVG